LSIKKLLPDPWQIEVKTLVVGGKIDGEVTKVTPYGAFVKLSDNLEGLLHVSQLGEGKKPEEMTQEGKTYTFEIISIEPELRKISLKLA
jgi:small subunit ribosomal protein S1